MSVEVHMSPLRRRVITAAASLAGFALGGIAAVVPRAAHGLVDDGWTYYIDAAMGITAPWPQYLLEFGNFITGGQTAARHRHTQAWYRTAETMVAGREGVYEHHLEQSRTTHRLVEHLSLILAWRDSPSEPASIAPAPHRSQDADSPYRWSVRDWLDFQRQLEARHPQGEQLRVTDYLGSTTLSQTQRQRAVDLIDMLVEGINVRIRQPDDAAQTDRLRVLGYTAKVTAIHSRVSLAKEVLMTALSEREQRYETDRRNQLDQDLNQRISGHIASDSVSERAVHKIVTDYAIGWGTYSAELEPTAWSRLFAQLIAVRNDITASVMRWRELNAQVFALHTLNLSQQQGAGLADEFRSVMRPSSSVQ